MDDKAIARLIEILETDPDFFVPVKRLWLTLQQEGLDAGLSLEEFQRELEEDDRFEFGPDMGTDGVPEDSKTVRELEAQGIYGGQRVKLRSRVVTADDIFAAMARSLARVNAALQGAWENRPRWDHEVEEHLLDILTTSQDLMSELEELLEQRE